MDAAGLPASLLCPGQAHTALHVGIGWRVRLQRCAQPFALDRQVDGIGNRYTQKRALP